MATVRIQLRRGTSSQWDNANPILAAGEIGIETDTNTFKFGDGATTWSNLDYALSDTVDNYIPLSQKGVASGVASLDASGFVPTAQLPPLAKVTVSAVANQAARLALTAETGDIAIQADNGQSYVLSASPASTDANWKALTGTEAVVDMVETALLAGTGLDKTYNDESGTITLDIDSTVATLTGTQTLTNKTLTSPSITTPTGIVKADVGLANVDNTSDGNKPISTATQSALDLKAPLSSPELTGTPTAPTANSDVNNTQIATTAFAKSVANIAQSNAEQYANNAITGIVNAAPSTLDTLNELAAALGDDPNFATSVTTVLATKVDNTYAANTYAPKADPIFSGVISLPSTTNIGDVSSTELSYVNGVTSGIQYQLDAKSPSDGPTFTGTVNLPSTTFIGDVSNVELSYVNGVTSGIQYQLDAKSPSDGPTFTGTVVLPSTTSIGDVSSTELSYVNGVTSGIQYQLDAKSPSDGPTFTGTVNLPSTTFIGDVSSTELSYVNGVTSGIQYQLDAKSPSDGPTFTGTVVLPSTTSIGDVSNVELSYVNGVTSGIQTQLDAKSPSDGPTFTGTVVLPSTTSIGDVSSTELSYINGVTSGIQVQLDAKLESTTASSTYAPIASPTFTGTVTLPNGAVTAAMILDGTIGTTEIADGAITSEKIANGTIIDADVSASAAISQSKVSGLTSDLALKAPLSGPTFTGTVTLPSTTSIGDVSSTEIGYIDGVTSAVQTQIDSKAPTANPTFTGTVTLPSTTSIGDVSSDELAILNGLTASTSELNILDGVTASTTELNYVDGVTSAIQTQLDAKASLSGATFIGSVEIDQNLVVDGNLTVNGTTFNASSTSIVIEDNIVQLAHQNAANTVDLGLVVAYNDGTAKHAGIVRDVSANKWKLFEGVTDEPSTTVNFAQGTLDDLEVADITASSATIGDVSNTELQYLNGVTSAVQTQIDSKAPTANPTFTGTVTVAASGIAFTDGTQTKEGVPSRTIINSATAAYNLSTGGLSLRDTLIECNSSSAFTVTIPANSTTAYPVGTSIDLLQVGTGQITVAGAAGVTLNGTPGLKLRTQWSSATLFKRATDTWIIMGDLTA